MIITRSPLRITLGGGGTDLPSYSDQHGGFLISAAIDKYVYVTVHQTFVQELIIKYSKLERANHVNDIQHPIIREALKLLGFQSPAMEITVMADIPAGTGLGSSGSFTTALLKGLHTYNKNLIDSYSLAEQACHLELNILNEPVGKQDQYIAALGGLNCFTFSEEGSVEVKPLQIDHATRYSLQDNLLLFFTGFSRSASDILGELDKKNKMGDREMTDFLHFIKELGFQSKSALESGDLRQFGELMNTHWERKRRCIKKMSNDKIDEWYQLARDNGAIGGKVVGAGGGGFLMFYVEDKMQLRRAMYDAGLPEVVFRFDFFGTQVVVE